MSIWVRAVCTKPLDGVSAEELQAGIAERLPWLAKIFRSKGLKSTLGRLAVRQQSPLVWEIHYRADPEHSIDAERYTDPANVQEEVGELTGDAGVLPVQDLQVGQVQ